MRASFYGFISAAAVGLALVTSSAAIADEARPNVFYRSVMVDGLNVFYREAGPSDAPTLLLLHGFPSSSRMFEPLFARLSRKYHLIAPDYPGFGHSDAPDNKHFAYTFDHIADVVDHFTTAVNLKSYVLYLQDYGGPVGFRLAVAHPERVRGIVIQNAVAHNDGLGAPWAARRAFWADRPAHEAAFREAFLSFAATEKRHLGSTPHPENIDPDLWTDEFAFLSKPGEADIQTDLFYDYRTNVEAYPKWQAYLRNKQPPLLVVWGKYDPSFDVAEATAYSREVKAEVHIIDAGHFAMDEKPDEVADFVSRFVASLPRE
jgi:pimeloyl-ACP methyl ester carboxylesterase